MTQSKHNLRSGRKRLRTVDEESQLFDPASKRRDLNPNRELLDISALSINASNGVNLNNGTIDQVVSPQHIEASSSSSSNTPHCSPHPQNIPPLPQNPTATPGNQTMEQFDEAESDDRRATSNYYTDINMVLKQAHLDLLQRHKVHNPE